MTSPTGILLGPPESLDEADRDALMRRHAAALKILHHATTTAEERLDLLRAVVAPSAAMVEKVEERDARGDPSWT